MGFNSGFKGLNLLGLKHDERDARSGKMESHSVVTVLSYRASLSLLCIKV